MKRIALILGVLLLTLILAYNIWLLPQLEVATGYAAKKMCSCHFIDGRHPDTIQKQDLEMRFIHLTRTSFNLVDSMATTSLFGLAEQKAQYKGGLGCMLIRGRDNYNKYLRRSQLREREGWATPDSTEINVTALEEAIDYAFRDKHKSRAAVVIHKGKLVGERYAPGYDSSSVFNGWSMTKSVTATLMGLLVRQQELALTDTALFEEWSDDRKAISLKDLLQMQSGLYFEEKYDQISTATNMLFRSEKVAEIPLSQELVAQPGSSWYYSSGTSNILSELIRRKIDNDMKYHRLPYDSLFRRIEMNSAVLETDESGTFVGSSFCYATARDWARFGQLYLQNGRWKDAQIIDSQWVSFVRQPAKHSKGLYGGHFWLNEHGAAYPELPHDLFSCNGFQGQRVFIFPDRDLVVVRMGLSEEWDFQEFLMRILRAFPVSTSSVEPI